MLYFSGWFAGPVIFGMIIDTSCSIWSASCSGQGACALYDNDDFRVKIVTVNLISKVLVAILHIIVFIKARRKTDWTKDDDQNEKENNESTVSMLNGQDTEMGLYPSPKK